MTDGEPVNNGAPRDPRIKGNRGILMCFAEKDGKFLWQAVHDMAPLPVDQQAAGDGLCSTPTVVGDRLYCEPCVYELATGRRIEDWGWKPRRGCGTMSASASSLFFRDNSATMFDLEAKKLTKVTTVTRPGCFINMIPAGGLLLVPEASSGCSCDYAVQASLAFMPKR